MPRPRSLGGRARPSHPGVVLVGDGGQGRVGDGGAGVGQGGEGGADRREDRQFGGLAVVDPFDDAGLVAAVGEFVQFDFGEGGAEFGGDVEAVDQVELARRQGGAGAGDALVDDPEEVAAFGLVDVQVELFGEFPCEGLLVK